MLNDYIDPAETFVTCPNQDVVYGLGFFDLDIEPGSATHPRPHLVIQAMAKWRRVAVERRQLGRRRIVILRGRARNLGQAPRLPVCPEAIHVGVMEPEHRVIGREPSGHVPADEVVAPVVRPGRDLLVPLLQDQPEVPEGVGAGLLDDQPLQLPDPGRGGGPADAVAATGQREAELGLQERVDWEPLGARRPPVRPLRLRDRVAQDAAGQRSGRAGAQGSEELGGEQLPDRADVVAPRSYSRAHLRDDRGGRAARRGD